MENQSSLVDTTGLGSYPPLPKQVATSAGNGPGKSSYANVTGKPSGNKLNFCTLFTPGGNRIDVIVSVESIRTISERYANTAYGYFLGKRVAYPVVANYVRNTWGSMDGLDAMLENGPWFICNNPLILRKWHLDENLLKENVSTILVWVKLYGAHVMTFSEDGLSAIATKLGTPLMLDSYTADMCICACCKVFGHVLEECPKNIGAGTTKNLKKTSQTSKGILVGQKLGLKPKQVYQPVSKKSTANTCGKKRNNSEFTKKVSKSNPFEVLTLIDNDVDLGTNGGISNLADKGTINVSSSNTPIGEKIDKIERQICEGKLRFVDDDENPLVPTGIVDSDSEVDVDYYLDNDDYDPYDDDMYENHDMSEHLQSICDDLDIMGYNTTRERRINHLPRVFAGVYLRVWHTRGLASGVSWSRGNDRGFFGGKSRMDVFQQTTRKKHPTVLYKTPRLFEKLEQSMFLGGRKDISHCRGLAHKRSEGRDASCELVLRGGRDIIGHTPYPLQKQPEVMLYIVGLSRRYFLGDDVYPIFLDDDDRGGAPNPTKVKTGTRPRTAHEVSLLTVTASRVIDMEDVAVALESSGTPSTIEKKCIGDGGRSRNRLRERGSCHGPPVNKRRRKSGNNKAEANAPPKALRRDYDTFRPMQSTYRGESLASLGLDAGSLLSTPAAQDPYTAIKSSDPEPLSYVFQGNGSEILTEDAATTEVNIQFSVGSPESRRSSSVSFMVGSPGGIYQPGWGVTNDCRMDTPDACQYIVDHIAPPGYFSELHHLPNLDFLDQYNITLARQVAMGSQLRLRFEQEARLLKKARSKIARRDQRIQAEVDMKKSAEAKNAELAKELDSLRTQFSDLQVSNKQLSDQMDARLDKLSVDFDEELYPHMLTMIAGRRWVIGHGLHLAIMKCAESSEIRPAFADVVST
nr:hypothetical protein [Tanacetum cinerariifolium]